MLDWNLSWTLLSPSGITKQISSTITQAKPRTKNRWAVTTHWMMQLKAASDRGRRWFEMAEVAIALLILIPILVIFIPYASCGSNSYLGSSSGTHLGSDPSTALNFGSYFTLSSEPRSGRGVVLSLRHFISKKKTNRYEK
ncbi:hypothetical protein EVAR_62248_1 [Eumeta japonica]|uniref:Uncharacterized protein n=1 Tax=Eumeta variegata TaxID=151549 RepID=A0A4C1ZDU4_EUMVA|nr:hypothetical protein EVAR_62248_1 [Eumeta japonica]